MFFFNTEYLVPEPRRRAVKSGATQFWGHGTVTPQRSSTDVAWDLASFKTTNYSRKALGIFAERFGLQIEDLSKDGGNLWVRTDDLLLGINEVLLKWGFEFKNARKGWWWSGR